MAVPFTEAEMAALRALIGEPPVVGATALVPDVLPGEIITSQWGNAIRDRTVQNFVSVAERDTEWTDAPDGAVCITLDTGSIFVRLDGAWTTLHRGGLHYARVRRNAATSYPTGSTQVIWDTVESDVEGLYSTSTGFYTCPEDGLYSVDGQVSLTLSGAGSCSSILSHAPVATGIPGTWTSQNMVLANSGAVIVRARGTKLALAGDKFSGNVNHNLSTAQAWRNPPSDQSFTVIYHGRP